MNDFEKTAKEAMDAILAVLDEPCIAYERCEDDVLRLVLHGEDIIMPVNLWVEPEYSLVTIGSVLPFKVDEAKADDVAIVLNLLNARIIDGSFYLDGNDRFVKFKITDSYLGAPVAKEAIRFHLEMLTETVDKYNDKLYALNEGSLDRGFFTTCL